MTTPHLFHASALDLPDAADGCDIQVVDPPYAASVHSRAVSTRTGGAGPRKRDFGFVHLSPELMMRIADYATQVRRWSIIFTDIESVSTWRQALVGKGCEYVRAVPWIRWSQPQISGDRPPSGCEMVVVAHPPGRKAWQGPGSLTHFDARCLRGADKHPTEKPLDLMLQIVSYWSAPGETVFDPCAGSFTTGLAARLLGREAVGLELQEDWAARGAKRAGGPLTERDEGRAAEFVERQITEASRVPAPKAKDGSDVKTFERAQKRITDAECVLRKLASK